MLMDYGCRYSQCASVLRMQIWSTLVVHCAVMLWCYSNMANIHSVLLLTILIM